MTPGEVLIHIEENQPKQIGGLSTDDIEALEERRKKLESQGVKVW